MERIMNGDYNKVAIDSNCFIYLIEGSPYVDLLTPLFQKIENGSLLAVTSILTMTEILVKPYKSKDYKLVEEYRTTLLNFPNLTFRDIDFSIANKAAACKAEYGLRTPDAIQLATAICEEADVFITNDQDFRKVDFPVVFL
jgi:predicted nucleic acid-binding protein